MENKFGRVVAILGALAALGALYRACIRGALVRTAAACAPRPVTANFLPMPACAAHASRAFVDRKDLRSAVAQHPSPPRDPRCATTLSFERARPRHSHCVNTNMFHSIPRPPHADHERTIHSAAVQLHGFREPMRRQLSAAVDALLSVTPPTLVADASASVRSCFARAVRARGTRRSLRYLRSVRMFALLPQVCIPASHAAYPLHPRCLTARTPARAVRAAAAPRSWRTVQQLRELQ